MTFPSTRVDRARAVGAAIGATTGLALALPVADVQRVCPPPGEGRTQCVMNEVVLTIGLHVLLVAMTGALVAQLALAAPGFWRARRAGTVLGDVPPMDTANDLLVAATWDRTYVPDGRTAVLGAPRVRWSDRRREGADAAPPAGRGPLPLGDDGRLAPDDLRAWLRA